MTLLVASVLLAAAGCDLGYNRLEDGFIRRDRVNEVQIPPDSGNVRVRADDSVTGVDVRRSVRYRGNDAPSESARIEGSTLTLDMDCGNDCSVSYDVRLPRGANVRGSNHSGNIELDGVGLVEVKVDSGTGSLEARTDSGNITVRIPDGACRVSADADSGQTNVGVTTISSGTCTVTAHADSGNITISPR
jgi:hypothetical protein